MSRCSIGLAIAVCLALIPAVPAAAADVTLTPSLGLRGEHNDNIDFSRTNKLDDYLVAVSPGLKLDYATPSFGLTGSAGVNVLRYMNNTDHDTVNQNYGLKGILQPWEKFKVRGDAAYVKDTTLDSQLTETGIVSARTDRHYYRGAGGVSYQLTERSGTDIDYVHTKTDYDSVTDIGSKSDAVYLGYNYTFNQRKDILTVKPYFREIDSSVSREDLYGFTLGLSHKFSQTLSANAAVGPRYADTKPANGNSDSSWGWTAEVNVENTWETASLSLGYKRDIDYSPFGEPVEVNNLYATVRYNLTTRLLAGVSGRLVFAKSTGNFNATDRRFIEVTPSLTYKFTENHTLELAYSYSQQYDYNLPVPDDRGYDRNRIWLFLNLNFPKKL